MTMNRQVILSYGMGVDSTAILLRWLEEPETAPCSLADLIVITAMTGDEFASSGRLVTDYVLPRFAEHGIRFVQVARNGRYEADGITVLSDTPAPTELFLNGVYKLSDEMTEAATIPTSGGVRKCSVKFKGFVLDRWIESELGGAPYTHVIGFAKGEERRVIKDQSFGKLEGRHPSYPLIEWGWDRERCEDYIEAVTGVPWRKSACVFCPFASRGGCVVDRWAEEPGAAAKALEMESIALRFNPRMKLFKTRSMMELVERAGIVEALEALQELEASPRDWAVYEMKRAFLPSKKDASKRGQTERRIRKVFSGTREEAEAHLATLGEPDALRVTVRARGEGYPAIEEFFVAAPAVVSDKEGRGFERAWRRATEMLDGDPRCCPKCDTTVPFAKVSGVFGFRTVNGKKRPQSWCRDCRREDSRRRAIARKAA